MQNHRLEVLKDVAVEVVENLTEEKFPGKVYVSPLSPSCAYPRAAGGNGITYIYRGRLEQDIGQAIRVHAHELAHHVNDDNWDRLSPSEIQETQDRADNFAARALLKLKGLLRQILLGHPSVVDTQNLQPQQLVDLIHATPLGTPVEEMQDLYQPLVLHTVGGLTLHDNPQIYRPAVEQALVQCHVSPQAATIAADWAAARICTSFDPNLDLMGLDLGVAQGPSFEINFARTVAVHTGRANPPEPRLRLR